MTLKNTPDRWGSISKTLHWLVVVLILCLGIVGLTMGELPKTPKYFWVYTAHKSFGITVLTLMIVRVFWRLYAGTPRDLPTTPRWQERIAHLTHLALYAMALIMPISGWLYDSASGLRPFKLFGLFNMPKLVQPDQAIRHFAHFVHEWGFWTLIALVAAHAGAAFYHHLFLHDATLTRMLPGRRAHASVPPASNKDSHHVA
ncbi:cytochrome b [Pseudoxanthomonas dokdonensis]|uniref:Cytochrome B561 n=1 Tax=Pseudoxanthomonas dokdonensis TaxID=344882 RepID=A0A0R0CUL0_9GAMM|nr:cytochrome b [Pseudoxanthomonas dokdonensis]KRG70162.1 cytochrome B561 [Pseudoxanthomonas dokdonensis]